MIGLLWDVIAMLRILAHEVEDPEEGGEIWPMAWEAPPPALRATSPCRGGMDERREARA